MITEEILSSDFEVIGSDETISHALSLFEKNEVLIVVDKNEYRGVITRKDILRAKIPPEAKVKRFVRHAPKVKLNTSIEEIARLMLESGIFCLPVFEGDKIKGVIKDTDIIQRVVEKEFGDMEIQKFMTSNPIFVTPDESIGKVLQIFKKHNVSRLPVVERGKIVGVITVRDLMEKVIHPEEKPEYGEFIAEKKRYLKIPVKGIMTSNPVILSPHSKVRYVVEEMIKNKIGGMIIGEKGKLVGIVTIKDLLEPVTHARKEERFFIQFCGETDEIEGFDREEGMAYVREFIRKYGEFLENGYIYVYLKQYREKRGGLHLIHCKIRISSPNGFFVVSQDGWGFRNSLKNAIGAIEKIIERERKN